MADEKQFRQISFFRLLPQDFPNPVDAAKAKAADEYSRRTYNLDTREDCLSDVLAEPFSI